MQQARALHQDTATTIALRESIRIHRSSVEEFQRGAKELEYDEHMKQDLLDRI